MDIENIKNGDPEDNARPSLNPIQKQSRRENFWLNLGLNFIIPALILMKGGQWFNLQPSIALIIALFFPLSYGLSDLIFRHKYNFLSILGFISILLTGGIGLLKLDKDWIAIKEAAVPSIIGLAILISLKTPYPLVRTLIYNENIINIATVEWEIKVRNNLLSFNRLLNNITVLLALSFLLSAILNFALAKILINSESGTEAFNEEIGRMTLLSYPIIVVPCTVISFIAFWKILSGLKKLSGLSLEEILRILPEEK